MSRPRKNQLRNRILAVLVSLVALWGFAAYVTVGEGVSLIWFATLEQQVAKPTEAVVGALQAERRETVATVAAKGTPSAQLAAARAATDDATRKLKGALQGRAARWSTTDEGIARLDELLRELDTLSSRRSEIDAGRVDRVAALAYFTQLVHVGHSVYDTFTVWEDSTVIYQTSTLLSLTHSQEMISQEDALLAGVIAADRFSEADRSQLARLVGVQRYLAQEVMDRLPGGDPDRYAALLASPAMVSLRAIEDRVVGSPTGPAPGVAAAQWRSTTSAAIEAHRVLVLALADLTVERVRPSAIWVIVRLALAAGLGLVAVVFSIRFSIRTLRSLQKQLAALRVAALDLAHERLPQVVERLKLGEPVDVDASAPMLAYGDDDIGLVGAAFNAVQETAIQATVEQAELRRGVRDIFLNLAHRIQALVHRQLKIIDAMERQATTDEELADLFRIDHLATRMRRNAENLIVLSGSPAGRGWRAAVPMVDVMRGALAEVEEYPRIRMRSADRAALAGRAVGDVTHLLAELMENAVTFSPPHTSVFVTGSIVASGYLIEIEDRGLGMSGEDMVDANDQISSPPDFQLSSTARLGFYVVGRLAKRHHIEVHLRRSAYDGVTASVLIPMILIEELVGPDPAQPRERLFASVTAAVSAATLLEPPRAITTTTAAHAGHAAATQREVTLAPSGLPLRVRRPARHVPRPRETAEVAGDAESPNGRTPEEISRLISAYVRAVRDATARDATATEDRARTERVDPSSPEGRA